MRGTGGMERTQAVNISAARKVVAGGRRGRDDGREVQKRESALSRGRELENQRAESQAAERPRSCGEGGAPTAARIPRKNVKSFNCDVTFPLEVGMSKTWLSRGESARANRTEPNVRR